MPLDVDQCRAAAIAEPSAENLRLLGISLFEADRFQEAEQAYRQAIAREPGYHKTYASWSILLLHVGLFDDSLKAAEFGLSLAPEDVRLLNCKGTALLNMGLIPESLAVFNRILGIPPQHHVTVSTSLGTITD